MRFVVAFHRFMTFFRAFPGKIRAEQFFRAILLQSIF